jgi:hypothetical protein
MKLDYLYGEDWEVDLPLPTAEDEMSVEIDPEFQIPELEMPEVETEFEVPVSQGEFDPPLIEGIDSDD